MVAERCGGESDEDDWEASVPTSVSAEDAFASECRNAMAIGMTYDEYWLGEPEIYEYKAALYLSNADDEFERDDRLAWMIGLYVQKAHGANMANAFAKKGAKPVEYYHEPQLSSVNRQEAIKKREENKALNAHSNFVAMARALGAEITEAASE